MSEFDDRRKEQRKIVVAFMPVYDKKKNVLLGYLRDLTLQGALVIGGKTLEVDTNTTLSFELPADLPKIKAKHLSISARIVRCIEDESPNSYKIGFEFTDVKPEHTKIIEALLERYHFRHKAN